MFNGIAYNIGIEIQEIMLQHCQRFTNLPPILLIPPNMPVQIEPPNLPGSNRAVSAMIVLQLKEPATHLQTG